jgi:23S rRNA pseudouridine1911/1915/1917 synthase
MPIGRSKYSFGKFGVEVEGKESLTEFKTIGKYKKDNKIFSLLEINLKTGRTHQIRVHLSYLKWPLVGDKLYGGDNSLIKRPFLHAAFIQFKHPNSGEVLSFKSEIPNELNLVLQQYEKV